MSDLDLSPALFAARADAARSLIDGQDGLPGQLLLFSGVRPAGGDAAIPVITIPLAYPCGVSGPTGLTLSGIEAVMINQAGRITWGRFTDSAGRWVLDADAAKDAGDGSAGVSILLDNDVVYPGASITVSSVVFREQQ